MDLLKRRNQISKEFSHSFVSGQYDHTLNINDFTFKFPAGLKVDGRIEPNNWLVRKHSDDSVYEPGLIAWLLAFGELFEGKKVRFIDIGALFGYVSVVAAEVFGEVEVIAVEANPNSADIVKKVFEFQNKSDRMFVANKMVTAAPQAEKEYLVYGFEFFSPSGFVRKKKEPKNFAKLLLRNFGLKRYQATNRYIRRIAGEPLVNFIQNADSVNIVKIDAEGTQALFLPPASEGLIASSSIVILEFDSTRKMKRYGLTNFDLCRPFVERGYKLFWCDHRIYGEMATQLTGYSEHTERNSLCVLIPPLYIT